jgi:CBS domain-containing protein
MAKTVSDVMTSPCECVGENDSVLDAAKRLAELNVGSMPICGEDDKLKGMITDRDIVVKCLAQGKDPAGCKTGELAEGKPVLIEADASANEALELMSEHQIRRLPVLDDNKRLAGIVSQADLATEVSEKKVGEMVEEISAPA